VKEKDDSNLPARQRLNKFIAQKMKDVYYWADEIRDRETELDQEPAAFLQKLRSPEDSWTVLLENGIPARSLSKGQETGVGYELKFYVYRQSVFAQVLYVHPGSPAEQAGLKRGDLITACNGTALTETNYTETITSSNPVVRLGRLTANGVETNGPEYALQATTFETNPILLDTVFRIAGKKIGYLFYLQFIDNQKNSLEQLNAVAEKLRQQDPDDFILDLRYNSGGAITAAKRLSSLLAPAYHVGREDLLITKEWNAAYQARFENQASMLEERFEPAVLSANLNLRHIYFLVSKMTASASELVISGLSPYLSETLIGEKTTGKYVGSVPYVPEDSDLKSWELYPIVFAYKNARGASVKNGLAPAAENESTEYADYLFPIGDPADPLLSRAIELITGQSAVLPASKAPSRFSSACRSLPGTKKRWEGICLQY